MAIRPYKAPSLIADWREVPNWYVTHSAGLLADLIRIAGPIWYSADELERYAMFKHLADEVVGDIRRWRFFELRDLIEEYESPEEFAKTLSQVRWMGVEVPDLIFAYAALYIELGKGWRYAEFSTDAFYYHYRVFNREGEQSPR